jgi:hypothetical protein
MGFDYSALMLYTFVHSGLPLQEETLQKLLAKVLSDPLLRTYQVALTAAALAAIDPLKYQGKLAQCAQFLADWQCDNGQWGYGDKYEPPEYGGASSDGSAKKTVAKIRISRVKKLGPLVGDNSNSQYAALGLRACSQGGCEIEATVLSRAIEWWEKSQQKDGGWSYHGDGVYQAPLGVHGPIDGGRRREQPHHAQAAQELRSQGRVVDHARPRVDGGEFHRRGQRATPAGREVWHLYFLYAMEPGGRPHPTELFGKRAWYAIGAAHLLKTQREDGSWKGTNVDMVIADTCFALLFLERVARRPPVATGGKTPAPPAK